MAPCDFYLFVKLHLAMKGKLYADVDAIQKASICTIVVFSAKETIPKATNKMFAKENQFFVFFIKFGMF